jgi:hypothetical protein
MTGRGMKAAGGLVMGTAGGAVVGGSSSNDASASLGTPPAALDELALMIPGRLKPLGPGGGGRVSESTLRGRGIDGAAWEVAERGFRVALDVR